MERVISIPTLAPRAAESHKGDYGRILLVAGGPGMAGAAILAARAALRAGAGLVTALIPRSLQTALATACPEATLIPLRRLPNSAEELAELAAEFDRFDAIGVGPGLGAGPWGATLLRGVLETFQGPHLLDADALNILAANPDLAATLNPQRVFTPHPGEFRRLTQELPCGDEARRVAAERFVDSHGGVLVLKGHRTLVTDGTRYYLNRTGNPGMATGGSGDVLTGIITSFLGQGVPPFEAACLGVQVHGRAGDLAAADLGETSLIASDLVANLPQALRERTRTKELPGTDPAAEESPS